MMDKVIRKEDENLSRLFRQTAIIDIEKEALLNVLISIPSTKKTGSRIRLGLVRQ